MFRFAGVFWSYSSIANCVCMYSVWAGMQDQNPNSLKLHIFEQLRGPTYALLIYLIFNQIFATDGTNSKYSSIVWVNISTVKGAIMIF